MTLAPPRVSTVAALRPPTLQTIPSAVAANVTRIRATTRSTIMAVVKADGYGHGSVAVARAAVDAGANWLGVTDVAEGSALRSAGFTVPILSWLNPSGIDSLAAATDRIDIAIGSVDELSQLLADTARLPLRRRALAADTARAVRVHLHADTGMTRGGCPRDEWLELVALAALGQQRRQIDVVGLMGHLPRADDADSRANAAAITVLDDARRVTLQAGFGPLLVHLAATSAALTDPATHFGMVRIGAGLVGIDPSETTSLVGASRLTAPILQTSRVGSGVPVGYGGDYVTDRPTHLSVVGLGYADGIPRTLARDAAVAIHGHRHRIVGRVSMDQIVIDTGATSFPRGTAVTVFGPEGGATPSIQEWARWAATIPHTIVTGIGPRVKRSIE